MNDLKDIKEYARTAESARRFSHTLGVASDCRRLASIFEFSRQDSDKLYAAALLHDITKERKPDEQEALCREFAIDEPPRGYASPTLHSQTAAFLARKLFPRVVDDCVFNAIRYHTTGRAGMNIHEMLLCFADYTESSRRYEGCRRLRREFYSQVTKENRLELLRKCLLSSFDMTITSLVHNGDFIDNDTYEARNHMIALLGQQNEVNNEL